MSYNIPILSIPAFYVLALVPHIYGSSIPGQAKLLNNINPGSANLQEQMKKKLSPSAFARFERSKSCHRNHIENMPLYFFAILAGLYAERETGQELRLTTFALSFLAVRVLYTINYITVETKQLSFVRTALYFVGVVLCFNKLVQASKAVGASS